MQIAGELAQIAVDSVALRDAIARRSPPKQKLRPAPVNTTARTAGLRAQVMAAASRSIAICRLRVLALSGRLSVTSATAPRVST